MKRFRCDSCHRIIVTDEEILIYFCPSCLEEMEVITYESKRDRKD